MRVVVLAEALSTLGGGEKHGLLLLAPLLGRHAVTVLHRGDPAFDPEQIRTRFNLNIDGLAVKAVRSTREVLRLARGADLFVNITYASLVPNAAKRGVLMVYFPLPLADHPPQQFRGEAIRQAILSHIEDREPDLIRHGTTLRAFREDRGTLRALSRLPLFALRKLAWRGYRDLRLGATAISSYTTLLANSQYTAGWVQRYYGRPAALSFPPIDTQAFRAGAKSPGIIAVGRFDDGENSKQFHVLIEAFRSCRDTGLLHGWTLTICGGTHGPASEAYLAQLRTQAAGLPVEFYPNLPFGKLRELYAGATLFWHAMGHGVDADKTPWRCEHFGMTTAEAMAAGCVPMVARAGGLTEIVTPASGYTWATVEELLAAVRRFMELNEGEKSAMATAASHRAEAFGFRAFFERTVKMYEELGVPCRGVEELLHSDSG